MELRPVDPAIWKACAGKSIRIPTINSRVYYFPQGHAEHASSPPVFPSIVSSKPVILCRVVSVRLLACNDTDEVFANIRLVPIDLACEFNYNYGCRDGEEVVDDDDDEGRVTSFAKVLTPSDANNGGGFSVPRFCADSIFPRLDFDADPPVQCLVIKDVQGRDWEFRHIYRGTPRRHLLTTGWSKFVNSKKLIAGDSVVFMRNNRSGELFVGVRRAVKVNVDFGGRWSCPVGTGRVKKNDAEEEEEGMGFSRDGRGKVSPVSVADAAELAARGLGFEVVYYPKAGSADFVVKAELVEESFSISWMPGMKVKMAMETEDSSKPTSFLGTVSSVSVADKGARPVSPWRMLQVAWDDPEVLPHVRRVSPWQVEYVTNSYSLHPAFPPAKKFRVEQNQQLLLEGQGDYFSQMRSWSTSWMGQLKPSSLNYNSFPAGMQGARQDNICGPNLSNLIYENINEMSTDHFMGNNIAQEVNAVSTELNIGSSQSDTLSPDSQSSPPFFGPELSGKQSVSSSVKVGRGSIQLFGKIIHMKEPVEGDCNHVGCTEDAGCKDYEGSGPVNNSLDLSLTHSHRNSQQA